jgi:hypothetical protein
MTSRTEGRRPVSIGNLFGDLVLASLIAARLLRAYTDRECMVWYEPDGELKFSLSEGAMAGVIREDRPERIVGIYLTVDGAVISAAKVRDDMVATADGLRKVAA